MTDVTHSTNLRAAAQLVSILGQKLIDENAVGIIELVKNAYDADATRVDVKLDNLHDPSRTQVIVHDDGVGMNIDEVLNKWMVAGYSEKANQKLRMERTEAGRLPLGQMGIGRFATARVGKKLMVITKKKVGPEVFFEIQWDAFDGSHDVGDVEIKVLEREPKFFGRDESGTRLVMLGAPEPWQESDVRSLHRKLLRMVSPIHQVEGFRLTFTCPEYPELQGLEPEKILDNFHFRLKAKVAASGVAEIEWEDRLVGRSASEQVDVWKKLPRAFHALNKRAVPSCGPFEVELRGWRLRKAELLQTNIKDKKFVEELAGVSVFRDGFRVLPYGEFGNDWMELNKRRVNNPTERFSTNQLIGLIHFSTEFNPDLVDQANRLGLQQTPAFIDFRQLSTAIVGILEERTLGAESSRRATVRQQTQSTPPLQVDTNGRIPTRPPGPTQATSQISGSTRPPDRLHVSNSGAVLALRAILSQVKSLRATGVAAPVAPALASAEDSLQQALNAAEGVRSP